MHAVGECYNIFLPLTFEGMQILNQEITKNDIPSRQLSN